MATSSLAISPRKLRSVLYSYSYQSDSNTPLVISVLASLIERTMARNERIAKNCSWAFSKDLKTRVFDCYETPDMTIQSYLERIFRYTRTGPSVYVVAYVYIDRFCQANPGFRINARNVHLQAFSSRNTFNLLTLSIFPPVRSEGILGNLHTGCDIVIVHSDGT